MTFPMKMFFFSEQGKIAANWVCEEPLHTVVNINLTKLAVRENFKYWDIKIRANKPHSDQTAPQEAVLYESTLFPIPSALFFMHF